jgi:nitric oxide reductase subunit C
MALEKKTARNMFVAGSLSLFAALIFLTVSFHQTLETRTQAAVNLTESAIRGKEVWEAKNCTNCHSRMGEGAYFAPDLTRAITRRGEAWVRHFLKDPVVAYYGTPENAVGRRKMPNLELTDREVEDLIAFFVFIEGIDTNGWPPPETLRVSGAAIPHEGPVAEGFTAFKEMGCGACHSVNGHESLGKQGPDITFAATRLTREWMVSEIMDPTKDYAETKMPSYEGAIDEQLANRIVDFLEYVSVKNGGTLNRDVVEHAGVQQ